MTIAARLQQHVPMEPVPGLQQAWAAVTPLADIRRYYLAGPDDQTLFQANAALSVDAEDIRRFLGFAQRHLQALVNAAPMAAVGGLRLDHYGCDSAIAVLPAAAELSPTVGRARDVDSRVYGLFPGWQCEVATTESETDAHYRFRRRIDYPHWGRDPQPYIGTAYSREDAGRKTAGGDRVSVADFEEALATLERVTASESGWLECTNYTGKTVRITHDRRLGLIWDAGNTDVPVDPEEIRPRLWSFTTTGR